MGAYRLMRGQCKGHTTPQSVHTTESIGTRGSSDKAAGQCEAAPVDWTRSSLRRLRWSEVILVAGTLPPSFYALVNLRKIALDSNRLAGEARRAAPSADCPF